MTLYAKWEADTYTVTYVLNNGSMAQSSTQVVFGKTFKLPVPKRAYYIFGGWRTADGVLYTLGDGEGTRAWDINKDTTLYADWTRKTYYVKITQEGTVLWLGENFSLTDRQDEAIPIDAEFKTPTELETWFKQLKDRSIMEGHKFNYFELEDGTPFTSWGEVRSLIENDMVLALNAVYEKEKNFYIMFNDVNGNNFTFIKNDYGETVDIDTIKTTASKGHKFQYWIVADVTENDAFRGTVLAPRTKFKLTKMPDLSPGYEEDGCSIISKTLWITFFIYSLF